jgi:hypothetical protein
MLLPNNISNDLSKTYNHTFFENHKNNLTIYKLFASYLKNKITNITDYGCGHGLLVECLILEGIDAYGLEGSESAKSVWNENNLDKYQIMDFTKEIDKLLIPNTEYVITTEVAEHIKPEYAENFIKLLLVNNPKGVYFGSATVMQDLNQNPTHVNEQSFIYWINLFNKYDYDIDIKETYELKKLFGDNIKDFMHSWWYPKNLFVLKPKKDLKIDFLDIDEINYIPDLKSANPLMNIVIRRDFLEYSHIILSKYLEYTQNKKLFKII